VAAHSSRTGAQAEPLPGTPGFEAPGLGEPEPGGQAQRAGVGGLGEEHDGQPCSTRCYPVNMSLPEITQRDLRSRSREIMDAVEHGQAFTVTRDGHEIAELIPIRRRPRFVSRREFAATSRHAPASDLDAFRSDQDAAVEHNDGDPYDR
jgi:prevent-host-death family protein